MSGSDNPLIERITQHYPELTGSGRRLADYLQLNPEKLLICSTNEIAEACGVSKTSVSRFIRKLGYQDHTALRNELIAQRDKGEPMLTSSIESAELQDELRSLERLWQQLANMDLSTLIEAIATAPQIKIIGYRNSYPLAMHFRQQLMQCRGGVELLPVPGQTIGEDLASIGSDDLVILVGIRRRVSHFAQIIEQLKDNRTLLLTDQSGQQYGQRVSHCLVCYMNNQAPLDSYAAPMSLISYLVNRTYRYLSSQAVKTSGKVSVHYAQLGELE